jgi:hypothetical protein
MFRAALIALLLAVSFSRSAAIAQIDPSLVNLVCYEEGYAPTPSINRGKPVQSQDGWNPACRAFDACVTEGIESSVCQLRIAVARLAACAEGDAKCEARAFIFAAGVDAVFDNGFYMVLDNESTAIALREGLSLLDASPTDAATRFTQFDQDGRDVPMLMLSAAAAMRAADLTSEANILTDIARDILPGHALLNAFSVFALGESGDVTRASHLAYTLGQVLADEPTLQPVVTSLQAMYPLDLTRFEPWLLYSVYLRAGSVGGSGYRDDHNRPPLSVRRAGLDRLRAAAPVQRRRDGEFISDGTKLAVCRVRPAERR